VRVQTSNVIVHTNLLRLKWVLVRLSLGGMWGKNSVLVTSPRLTLLKQLFLRAFAAEKDGRNATPHINVDGIESIREQIHNRNILLRCEDLEWHRDYIAIDVGFGKHFTLVYSKGICKDLREAQATVESVWLEWIAAITDKPDMPVEQVKEAAAAAAGGPAAPASFERPDDCVVCMEATPDIVFNCRHHCCCAACAAKVAICPLCRVNVTTRTPKKDVVFI
jgi:hypothetical protein